MDEDKIKRTCHARALPITRLPCPELLVRSVNKLLGRNVGVRLPSISPATRLAADVAAILRG